jgi:hypothetical protein
MALRLRPVSGAGLVSSRNDTARTAFRRWQHRTPTQRLDMPRAATAVQPLPTVVCCRRCARTAPELASLPLPRRQHTCHIHLTAVVLCGGGPFPTRCSMPDRTAMNEPGRVWRSYGNDPLPAAAEAMAEPFAAFPSWFLRVECDRCGKVRMVNEKQAFNRQTSPCCMGMPYPRLWSAAADRRPSRGRKRREKRCAEKLEVARNVSRGFEPARLMRPSSRTPRPAAVVPRWKQPTATRWV